MSEMDKLESYLQFKSIHHDRIVYPSRDAEKVYFDQIIVFDDRGHPAWDAICYPGTYGYQRGLVEVKGSPVVKETDADTVVGFLTAEAIIHRMGDETYSDPTLRFHIKSRDYYAEAMELVDAFPDQKYNLLPEPVITYAVENNVRLIEAYLMYKRGELK